MKKARAHLKNPSFCDLTSDINNKKLHNIKLNGLTISHECVDPSFRNSVHKNRPAPALL
jgi:hypothetical protein